MSEELSAPAPPQPMAEPAGHQGSDDPFHALASRGARDAEVRRRFAAILDAQDLPERQRDETWRAFLAAANAHLRVRETADD